MRYPASEKLEIIRLVEQSHLPVRRTLEKLGVSRATFTDGATSPRLAGRKPWKTDFPGRTASGTESAGCVVSESATCASRPAIHGVIASRHSVGDTDS